MLQVDIDTSDKDDVYVTVDDGSSVSALGRHTLASIEAAYGVKRTDTGFAECVKAWFATHVGDVQPEYTPTWDSSHDVW